MTGKITGRLADSKGCKGPIVNARVFLYDKKPEQPAAKPIKSVRTDEDGRFQFVDLEPARYFVRSLAFGQTSNANTPVRSGETAEVPLEVELEAGITLKVITGACDEAVECSHAIAGRRFLVVLGAERYKKHVKRYEFSASPDGIVQQTPGENEAEIVFPEPGDKRIEVRAYYEEEEEEADEKGTQSHHVLAFLDTYASVPDQKVIGGNVEVRLQRTHVRHTLDQALWVAIRNRTHAIGFNRYQESMNRWLQAIEGEKTGIPKLDAKLKDLGTPLHGVAGYDVMKAMTEIFLLMECGIRIEDDRDPHRRFFDRESETRRLGEPVSLEYVKEKLCQYLGPQAQLPYITKVVKAAFPEWLDGGKMCCDRVLTCKLNEPCLIELIWSYWHEEGMLAQTMNAVTRRFQNVRGVERDPIAHLEIDPLRPLNNLIWGFVQDEIRRLSVKRRAYEYEHEYGLTLYGKAVHGMRPADSRSKFLEAFHNLLHLTSVFFKEDNDTTVIADGFPLLNALKEVHLILGQGAQNQFGDLPWTARAEMMLQQWMLARPEIRDFLQSRAMVPYREPWMPQVDTMKTLQGWSDVTVTHFRDLGVYGEQILLSVRYGDWVAITDEDSAKNWARYWRPELQAYLHAYRAATGIDLTNPDTVDATVPAVHLQKRLVLQQQRAR